MNKKRIVLLITLVALVVLAALPSLKSIADAAKRVTAYQLNVNDEKWFVLQEKDTLEDMLSEYQKHYLSGVDKNAQIKNIQFVQKIEVIEVELKPEEINTFETAKEMIYALEQEAVVIEVKKGDNLWNLAKTNNISVEELEALNPHIDSSKIFPGDKLIVNPLNPVLDVEIVLENTVIESIPFKVESQKDTTLYKNQKKIIKEGMEGEKEVTYSIKLLNGYQHSLEVKNENILREPVNAIVKVGTKTTVSRGGSVNYGVVSGKRISSSYGSRIHPITGKRSFHDGIDIAAAYGNGVYSYSDGRVIAAGWDGGYGNTVLIDHGNGLKTRYGHLAKITVRVGQKVGTGDKIGTVGSTGYSTGPHLHFEVIKNGQTKNPLNYI